MAFLSDTLARVKPSPTIAVTTKAAELKAAGFAKVSHKRMLFGTVALHQAQA